MRFVTQGILALALATTAAPAQLQDEPYVDPLNPREATLKYASYRASPAADGVVAFRLVAALNDADTTPRIGLRGTAKLHSEPVSLGFFLFRRPLGTVRRWLGW